MKYLSKSDFKVASSCIKKLYYKKNYYPSTNSDNEFLQMLAEGGYVVGKMATMKYPNGEDLSNISDRNAAIEKTNELLKRENVVIFEGAFLSNQKLIRVDILEKNGNKIKIIEVKAKSHDSFEDKNDMMKKLKEYIEDVAFQTLVIKELFPDYNISSYLFTPDKSQTTINEGLAGWFNKNIDNSNPSFRKVEVDFKYPNDKEKIEALNNEQILQMFDVNEKVAEMLPSIKTRAENIIEILNADFKDFKPEINKECFKCEYKVKDDINPNGFKECWGKLAEPKPHISEMFHVGTIGGTKNPYVNELILEGKTNMFDIKKERLVTTKGEMGARSIRQSIQLANTKTNSEWFSEDMANELKTWTYPLFFIDFETSTNAVPFHKDMRAYETIAFQWSCHIIERPGVEPKHYEWINMDYSFPNFRFAEALMEIIPDNATLLMWATHENTTLRTIYNQMESRNYVNPKLKTWLEKTVKMDSDDTGRFIDMNAFTLKHYFHPYMQGKTSIKKTLPAIWNNNPYLHQIPWFKKYANISNGEVLSPYDTLAEQIMILEDVEVVKEGTAAMRAYYEIMFGDYKDNLEKRENWRDLLLQYCELDTMAMVIIWTHWMKLTNLK